MATSSAARPCPAVAVWSNASARDADEHGGRGPQRGPRSGDQVVAIALGAVTLVVAAAIVVAEIA